MSNLLMRLRMMSEGAHGSAPREAADEIERLRERLERAEYALNELDFDFRKLERALDETHRSQMQSMRAWQEDGGEV